MKRVILTLAGVLCCASLLTSCKKDSSGSDSQTVGAPAYVVMNVSIPCTDDMLNNTDMSISYEAGNEKNTETVTSKFWSKEFKVKLPATISISRAVTLKDGLTIPADASFAYTKGHSVSWKFLDENGKEAKTGGVASIGNTTRGKGAKVQEMIEQGRMNLSINYSFDKDGKLQE